MNRVPGRARSLAVLRLWGVVAVAGLALSGCGGSGGGGAGLQAWFDAPMNDSVHPVAPMEIVLHAADPGGVAMVEVSVNGEVLSRRPPDDISNPLVTFRADWDPQAPGEYLLAVRAQNHAGVWSAESSTSVTLTGPATRVQQPPLVTPRPSRTPPPAVEPTRRPTPAPAACTDAAKFIADVTIPDNTNLPAGAPFTKIWRLRNDGTCTWNEEYKVVFTDGAPMNNPTPLSIPNLVAPGGTIDIAVDLVAPSASGSYTGNYQIRNPQGVHFGVGASGQTPFYVKIVVGAPSGPSPTAPPVADTQAPSVSISHSPSGNTVSTTQAITFTANASDNVGVTRIDIYVAAPGAFPGVAKTCNNTTSCSYTGGPYGTQGNLSYYAVARDAAGNQTTSSVTTIVIYIVVSGLPAGSGV